MISARKAYAIGQILKKANDLEIKGQVQDAIDEVRKAVDINPEDGNLYNRLGDLHLKLDEKDESLENFRKGVEAFRRDNFPRNALALSKKILRNAPDHFDMYYTIADLLVELDEKQDAAKYMFEYIEKQAKREKEKEVLNAIEYLQSLEIRDDRVQDRIAECYNMYKNGSVEKKDSKTTVSESVELDDATAAALLKPETVAQDKKTKEHKTEEPQTKKHKVPEVEKILHEFDGTNVIRKDIGQLDDAVKQVENAVVELRKTIRLDDVILVLDKSLSALSKEQKNALGALRDSVVDNLNYLQKSIEEMSQNSGKNMSDTQSMLDRLNKALASLSKNQAVIAEGLKGSLAKLDGSFKTTTENSLRVVKSILENYKHATDDMCARLDDTKEANGKLVQSTDELVKSTGDMKQELNAMGDSLSKFIEAQEFSEKKRDRYIKIILVIISAICGLFVVSLILK